MKVLMKLRHKCLHTSFDSWLHTTQREIQEQERIAFTEKHLKAFAQKEGETHRLKQNIIEKFATRWYLLAVSKSLRRWQAIRDRNRRLRGVFLRMFNTICALAFDAWLAATQRDTVLLHRSRFENALHRWLRWGVSDAFSTWRESTNRNLSRSLFVHGMVQRVSQQQDETKEQHLKLLGERLLRKWFNRSLVRCHDVACAVC